MPQPSDSQMFWELKTFYPWLGDDQLALLQGVYHTWKQLGEANRPTVMIMLAGLPRQSGTPDLTAVQVDAILAYAKEKVRLQEVETT